MTSSALAGSALQRLATDEMAVAARDLEEARPGYADTVKDIPNVGAARSR